MSEALQIRIVSPEKTVFEGEIKKLVVPGSKGIFEVLSRHASIISSLEQGIVRYYTDDIESENILQITGGFIQVRDNCVTLCVELDNSGV